MKYFSPRLLLPIFFATALIQSCCKKTTSYTVEDRQYIFSPSLENDGGTAQFGFILPYRDSLQKTMNTVLAFAAQPLIKELPEGTLGNYCADACFRQVKEISHQNNMPEPDFLFLNHGGLRASLPQGKITLGNIYEVMPFENELIVMDIPGIALDTLFQLIASKGGAPVSGVRFTIEKSGARNILIQGKPIVISRNYHVATSDYLANGGDGFDFLKKFNDKKSLSLKVRDALIADLKKSGLNQDTLIISKDGRIIKMQ